MLFPLAGYSTDVPLGKLFLKSPDQILLLVIHIWRNAIAFSTVPWIVYRQWWRIRPFFLSKELEAIAVTGF